MEMEEEQQTMWWRKLGFYTNPFTIKPAPFDNKVFGQDNILEDLYYKIPAGTMSFIEGNLGTGKTTILKNLISKFRGQGKVIYFSCNRIDTELNIEELLKGKYGFWGRLFGMMPKEMIVLLDESQQLSSVNTERIKYFFDQGNIKSVVFTGTNYSNTNLHESIKERIGQDGLFRIKELGEDKAIALVRNRIGNSTVVNDDMIKKLWHMSGKNPRRLLQRLDRVFRYAVENMETELKEDHLKKIFDETKPAAASAHEPAQQKEKDMEEVNSERNMEEKKEVSEEKKQLMKKSSKKKKKSKK
ncbi:AAA family ATPase [Candidatus Woesearchaeota archaeon]|nr:AAA family ATPase [Candidatus Woesearchaeota archaeon]